MNNDWMWGKTKLDPAYSGLDQAYKPSLPNGGVTGASRVIPSPSNTNWNSTFSQNTPESPSGTDWGRTFGSKQMVNGANRMGGPASNRGNNFSFDLSPIGDRSGLSLSPTAPDSTTATSQFYRNRTANMDLTKRDHEMYGAGSDYGFNY